MAIYVVQFDPDKEVRIKASKLEVAGESGLIRFADGNDLVAAFPVRLIMGVWRDDVRVMDTAKTR